MVTQATQQLANRQSEFLQSVGANVNMIAERQLPCFADAENLELAATSQSGREYFLEPSAAEAWRQMLNAATADGVSLIMISAYRSFDYQAELIKRKLVSGTPIQEILATLAPPGCSEHHSGFACDIGTMGCPPAEEEFEKTAAFAWLERNAERFGFSLSFPRNNVYGYIYEPWHWRFGK